jgi:amidase
MSELWRLSAVELAALVKARKASAVEVAKSALARLDEANPAINAVVQFMPDEALAAAGNVDAVIARGEDPGPLAGVPVTTKVNVDQKGFATTNGLRIHKDLVAKEDNPVVANLKKAGAVVIGRTNTPAFSLHWFTRNSLHGHTLNPHNPAITPGGSSGGAAAATAAGIGAVGHGTDIAGSVRYPAYACGIHGLRPSLGRVPAVNFSAPDRHIGAQIMAVSGPLARSMADVRLGLKAMAAEDQRDPWWVPAPLSQPPQPRRAALIMAPDGLQVDERVKAALSTAAGLLEAAGWHIEERNGPPWREPARLQATMWLAEFRRTAGEAVAKEADPDATFIYRQMVRHCPDTDLNGFLDTLQQRASLVRTWSMFLKDFPLIICPVSGELPFPDLLDLESPESFDRVFEAMLPQISTPFLGLPGLSVAMGREERNVPTGVQLIAGRFREDTLLEAGATIEAQIGAPDAVDPAAAGRAL